MNYLRREYEFHSRAVHEAMFSRIRLASVCYRYELGIIKLQYIEIDCRDSDELKAPRRKLPHILTAVTAWHTIFFTCPLKHGHNDSYAKRIEEYVEQVLQ
jgi:hypothetical protein